MLLYYNIQLMESDESDISNISNDDINDMNSLPLYYFNSDISNDIDAIKKLRITEEKNFVKNLIHMGCIILLFMNGDKLEYLI